MSSNTALPAPPAPSERVYVHRTPPWLVFLLRAAFAVGAITLTALAASNWTDLPGFARVMTLVLVPAFTVLSAWHEPWRRTIRFVADDTGLYFPSNPLVMPMPMPRSAAPARWLLVPWSNVDDLRVSSEAGESTACVAMRVRVSEAERAEFFAHVGRPVEWQLAPPGWLELAYGDVPPWPRTTVRRLTALRGVGASGG